MCPVCKKETRHCTKDTQERPVSKMRRIWCEDCRARAVSFTLGKSETGTRDFEKEFAVSRHQPFGKTTDYVKCIEEADSAKMAKLIRLVGMLLQTKIYLFWYKNSRAYSSDCSNG